MGKKKSTYDDMRVHRFTDHIYHAEIWFYHRCMPEDVERHLRKKLNQPDITVDWDWKYDGGVSAVENKKQRRQIYVLWVRHHKDFYTLLHECFHLTCRIFRHRGILLDFEEHGQEEHFAYYQDALFKGMWRLMAGITK